MICCIQLRTEVIHPLIVHFPLALLLTGIALRFAHLFLRKSPFDRVSLFSSWVLLFLGVCSAWLAVIAGEFAEDIVRSGLCKPEVLEQHKALAYSAASVFSAALILDIGRMWVKRRAKFFLSSAIVLFYSAGVVLLILAGGHGASLVYEQGAAVERVCK